MLTDDQLSKILTDSKLLLAKDLRNAKERQRNVEGESLEESLIFLGLADYAKLGQAYALHYELPYFPIFHTGITDAAKECFPLQFVKKTRALPFTGGDEGKQLSIVCCEPDNDLCKSQIEQLSRGGEIEWRVASNIEIDDTISKFYHGKIIKRENQAIKLPFEFRILDHDDDPTESEDGTENDSTNSTTGAAQTGAKRVILVEPDHNLRNALKTLLTREGYRVTAVVDEDEAIKELLDEDAVYLLTRRIFRSRTRRLEASISEHKRRVEIRYFSNLGGIILGEELSPEELFRNYLATVKLLLDALTREQPEIARACHLTAHYARLVATASGLKRKSQQALLLAVYLKEIGLYNVQDEANIDSNILSLIPVLPYEKSAATLKKIEDSFGLSEIIAQIDQPAARAAPAARIITLLTWFVNGLGTDPEKEITADIFRQQLALEPKGSIDPQLAEELLQIISHEQHLTGRARSNGTILIIDPTFERDHNDLFTRFIKESYEINFAQSAEQATDLLEQHRVVLIISEVRQKGYNGIDFCRKAKQTSPNLPFCFFTSENREDIISKALVAGADDFLAKDSSAQVVFLKLNRLIQRDQRTQRQTGDGGVSGSLQEMGFMETVQILANREKDALIKITDQNSHQAEVYLHAGEIIYARCKELEGENAIYELLGWEDGFFQVDTPKNLPERNVFGSTEAIMLEGCRLLDEESRDLKEATNQI